MEDSAHKSQKRIALFWDMIKMKTCGKGKFKPTIKHYYRF